jgi:glutamyl-tRNA reductase
MSASRLAALRAFSISHHTVGLGALPALSLGCGAAISLHGTLTAAGIPSVVITTCNRTEVYWQSSGPGDDRAVRAAIAVAIGPQGHGVLPAFATRAGGDAARHLMRVAAGLESLVVGEAEILGQVRAALDASPGAGRFLTGVVRAAIRAGRMARAETAIGVGAQSVASAAVRMLAEAIPLSQSRVAVVGAGDTGARTARHLRALGASSLAVINRTWARAAALAAAIEAEGWGLEALPAELVRADAVVFAIAATRPLVAASELAVAMDVRAGRRMTLVDLSMPAAVEPGGIEGVDRLDLAAIEREVAADRARRAAEIPKVEAVLDRELALLERWADRLFAGPRGAAAIVPRLEAAG